MKRLKIHNKNGNNLAFLRSKELSLAAKGLMSMLVYGKFTLSKKDNNVLRETLDELQRLNYIVVNEIPNNDEKYLVISQKGIDKN